MITRKIIVTTIGSLGDLHPCIALGLELRKRGHDPILATTECYREKVEGSGLCFHRIRPAISMDQEMMSKILSKTGVTYFIRDVLLSNLRETYDDLTQIASDADLMIAGDLVFAAPIVAEKHGLPWVSAVLSPSSFASVYDLLPNLTSRLGERAAEFVGRSLRAIARVATRTWMKPIDTMRTDLGLPLKKDALLHDRFSPHLVLGLFSSCLGGPYPDWPLTTAVTGSVWYDGMERATGMSRELTEFLDQGEPPVVFTLGSSGVLSPGSFYRESVKAAQIAKKRAILLIGKNQPPPDLSRDIVSFGYEPYGELFPRALAVVQAAGAGGIAHLLKAGRPGLLLPLGAFDQPTNADRLKRLGLVRVMHPGKYTGRNAASEISRLLNDPAYVNKAQEISRMINCENGGKSACEAIEKQMEEKQKGQSSLKRVPSEVGCPATKRLQ
jgi:rhamnosyltransferase subunit B